MKLLDIVWVLVLALITAILIVPLTHAVFIAATQAHSYAMAFGKFAIMATMGELMALRVVSGNWKRTKGMVWKAIIWGIIGMLTALMFQIFNTGVQGAIKNGFIAVGEGLMGEFLTALWISVIMNLTFGTVFMAAHRISDAYVDSRADGTNLPISQVIAQIDWVDFIRFVVCKTLIYFWVPAQTITFLLPPEFRVMFAAYLSIALGAIMTYAHTRYYLNETAVS